MNKATAKYDPVVPENGSKAPKRNSRMPKYTPIQSGASSKKLLRNIETPEGIELAVYLASRGDRAGAVVIDFIIILIAVIAVGILGAFVFKIAGSTSGNIFYYLSYFFLRSFYFIFFELKWKGQTPGKRYLGLRVIKRSGGRLDASAIFARNLMREVEIYLPMTVIFAGLTPFLDGWLLVFSWIWCAIMVFMPFFNKDNMRAGDMVGGTWVIRTPKTVLLEEVGRHASEDAEESGISNIYFTREQLSIYGIYELHTLENVLRNETAELHQNVARKIQNKIKWDKNAYYGTDKEFLLAFYSELRRHHEGEILMGRRKKNKFENEKKQASQKVRGPEQKPAKKVLTAPPEERPAAIKNILKDRD